MSWNLLDDIERGASIEEIIDLAVTEMILSAEYIYDEGDAEELTSSKTADGDRAGHGAPERSG